MAYLAPSIVFIQKFRSRIQQGYSLSDSLQHSCEKLKGEFSTKIAIWLANRKSGLNKNVQLKTEYQKAFLEIVQLGLEGAPIVEHLIWLENEMVKEFERQWKAYIESLPFYLGVPLLLLFFPAYILMLFGPLLIQFLGEFQ